MTESVGTTKTRAQTHRARCAPKAQAHPAGAACLILLMIVIGLYGGRSAAAQEALPDIPLDTKPCQHLEYWPLSLASAKVPVLVHFRSADEGKIATEVIDDIEAAWDFEVQRLGFSPPLGDAGECGPNNSFNIFLWRGKVSCYVDSIHESEPEKDPIATPWGGRRAFMVVDPWGKYGKDILGQTLAHELNHASQAVDDWYAPGDVFEMTATYVEQYFKDAWAYNIADFQAHPDWGLLFNDSYETYYMYGSALYLYFLRDYYFSRQGLVDEKFAARLWFNMRKDSAYPFAKRPNLVDGLNQLVAPFGDSVNDSALVFARWRYYAGTNDDGKHFKPWRGLAAIRFT